MSKVNRKQTAEHFNIIEMFSKVIKKPNSSDKTTITLYEFGIGDCKLPLDDIRQKITEIYGINEYIYCHEIINYTVISKVITIEVKSEERNN